MWPRNLLFLFFADGFCYIKFLERRRALEYHQIEISRRLMEKEDLTVKKVPFRRRLVYVKKNPKNSLWLEYVMGGSYPDRTARDGKVFRAKSIVTSSTFKKWFNEFEHFGMFKENLRGCYERISLLEQYGYKSKFQLYLKNERHLSVEEAKRNSGFIFNTNPPQCE